MSKKTGLFPLITGMIAGAAAVFFSDEKNRKMAKEKFSEAKTSAKQLKKKYDADPDKTIKEVVEVVKTKGTAEAKKLSKKVKKIAKSARA
ncbi:MAG TPA: hypothetical protein PKX78_04445 [Candidatus Woesebacteria bacterium]|nr:hypothetical protein [Candidatus Woesebacteria bacterium]